MQMYKRCFFFLGVIILFTLPAGGCELPPIHEIWRGPAIQYGTEGSDTSLLVIKNIAWLYGYGNPSGRVVIRPQYHDARPFYEGLAAVKNGWGMYGYINQRGETVIPFRYYRALDFHNGRAIVGTDLKPPNPKLTPVVCSIIDTEGNIVAETDYNFFTSFSDGMMFASGYDAEGCYMDDHYNVAFKSPISYQDFHDGLAVFSTGNTGFYYVDKSGKQAFPAEYPSAGPFSEGLASVLLDEEHSLAGYINKTGKVVIPPRYKTALPFGEGYACVCTSDDRWVIIDRNGKTVCEMDSTISIAKSFSEGLCAVGKPKGKPVSFTYGDELFVWGYMDITGKLVIDYQYDIVTPFKNGIAQVMVDGKIGYIDKTGKYIWEPK